MITLYRKKNQKKGDEIKAKLEQLILAYRVEFLHEDAEEDVYIEDGSTRIESTQEIEEWFLKLEKELSWQRSISGDGCYLDPDTGDIC